MKQYLKVHQEYSAARRTFSTLFSVFHLVMKHCISCLICYFKNFIVLQKRHYNAWHERVYYWRKFKCNTNWLIVWKVTNYMKEDHHSYRCNFSVAKRKPEKNSGLCGIRTLDHCGLLPVGLLAQLIECCTGITEVKGLNPVQAWIFCIYNCDDLDCEQSLFCLKICKQEYLSSKVVQVLSAQI